MAYTEPKIEEVDSDDSGNEAPATNKAGKSLNRVEKKARKGVLKLGFKEYQGSGQIIRVTVKKQKNILFVISSPDVWHVPGSDSFVVFGEARIEDLTQQQNAMRALGGGPGGKNILGGAGKALEAAEVGGTGTAALGNAGTTTIEEGEAESGATSGGGAAVTVEESDIELVMTQVNCSREKAIEALKAKNNDIVETIMSLSEG